MLSILESVTDVNVTVIDKSIGHPSKIVMLIRGDAPGTGEFVGRAGQAANLEWRDVLWLKDDALVDASSAAAAFEGSSAAVVVLDFEDNRSAELDIGVRFFAIRKAFAEAEGA